MPEQQHSSEPERDRASLAENLTAIALYGTAAFALGILEGILSDKRSSPDSEPNTPTRTDTIPQDDSIDDYLERQEGVEPQPERGPYIPRSPAVDKVVRAFHATVSTS
jgi:hypothetical protein